MQEQTKTAGRFQVQQIIVTALLFMLTGTALELYLLGHYEGTLQFIPLLCIGSSLLLMGLLLFRNLPALRKIFQVVMGLTALSGCYGVFLHLQANLEFEQEMKPTAGTWEVFVESLSGALPTLAPASLIVLALIGYSYIILLNQT